MCNDNKMSLTSSIHIVHAALRRWVLWTLSMDKVLPVAMQCIGDICTVHGSKFAVSPYYLSPFTGKGEGLR